MRGNCHLTPPLPTQSCVSALRRHVGSVTVRLAIERLPSAAALAARHRVGQVPRRRPQTSPRSPTGSSTTASRSIHPRGLVRPRRGLCGGPGWRRLLKFTASVKNVGGQPLHIGAVDFFIKGADTPNQQHHLFEYSACHNHSTSRTTGASLGPRPGDKRAFCRQTTPRYFNDETTRLTGVPR